MSIEGRKESLKAKHETIENRIDELTAHPSVSDLEVAGLKKQKLAIKDELAQLEKEGDDQAA